MTRIHWLGRALLYGFLWIFFFAASELLLDGLGIWEKLPAGLTRGAGILTGTVLVFELAGHLLLSTRGLDPDRPNAA